MKEYDVSFYAAQDGGFVLDIHSSSGTSPYAKFTSWETIRDFFASQGIHEERLTEIQTIYSNLKPGHGYHEKMFLPDSVIDAMEKIIAQTGGVIDGQLPESQALVRPDGQPLAKSAVQ